VIQENIEEDKSDFNDDSKMDFEKSRDHDNEDDDDDYDSSYLGDSSIHS
jgi:hypothetical protein